MQKTNLSNTALITGGRSGIGRAIAKKFTEAGIEVVIADDALEPEEEGKQEKAQTNLWFKTCDVGNPRDIDELYSWTREKTGLPDILVINAGQGIRELLCEGDPDKWQKVINTNLMGALRCIRAFVPEMLEKKKGHVFFISSVAANQPHPYGAIYSASKTALEIVAENLRLETLPHIHVTVISPGITYTGSFQNQVSGTNSVDEMCMGSISPEEIAEDVFYSLNKKTGTSINKIITRPIAQSF
jgi:NADP-dependent 3-hydroxy acid dehydrogenase YdfG